MHHKPVERWCYVVCIAAAIVVAFLCRSFYIVIFGIDNPEARVAVMRLYRANVHSQAAHDFFSTDSARDAYERQWKTFGAAVHYEVSDCTRMVDDNVANCAVAVTRSGHKYWEILEMSVSRGKCFSFYAQDYHP